MPENPNQHMQADFCGLWSKTNSCSISPFMMPIGILFLYFYLYFLSHYYRTSKKKISSLKEYAIYVVRLSSSLGYACRSQFLRLNDLQQVLSLFHISFRCLAIFNPVTNIFEILTSCMQILALPFPRGAKKKKEFTPVLLCPCLALNVFAISHSTVGINGSYQCRYSGLQECVIS